jgi:hypothetical protein
MYEERIIFKPEYENFFLRIEALLIATAIIGFMAIYGSIILFTNGLLVTGIIFIVSIIIMICSIFKPYVSYLVEFIIDNTENTIEIKTNRFDKKHKHLKTSINEDIHVQLNYHWFRRHPKYEIRFYDKRKCIFKQIETKGWSKEKLENIKSQINLIKKKQKQ